jgi:pilus assembly protein CpaB
MIGLALVTGVIAVIVASNWLLQRSGVATGKVVVASRTIDIGTPIQAEMLSAVDWPSANLPAGYQADPTALVGRVVKLGVERGEPVLESKLAPVGARGGLSALVEEGKRAVTVKVNEVVGVAGFALPGTYVDVLVNAQDDSKDPFSKIVLEKVLVLAVAQEASRDETKPKVVSAVTLELAPEQAEKLDLARSIGTLSLVLRNQLDKDTVATGGARRGDLLARGEQVVAPRPVKTGTAATNKGTQRTVAKKKPAGTAKEDVEIIKGTQKATVTL